MTDDLSGRLLSRKFLLKRRIGVGGMATVYEAVNTQIDKRVAVKVLKPEYLSHDTLMLRFQSEARLAAKMNHPNMVQITDYDVDGDIPYIVMEYLEGVSLSDLVHEQPVEWRRVVNMCAQVCDALQYAHDRGLLHRDIKPSNVFLVDDPSFPGDHVKLLDFGIAKLQHLEPGDPEPLTRPSQIPGTPEYMAPEQAQGDPCETRTDLYSLGVMMYRLLTGRLPFYAATPTETLTQHVLRAPVPPRQLVPDLDIPEALENIVLRAMAKRPAQRWDNARALRTALLRLVEPPAPDATGVHDPHRLASASMAPSAPAWSLHAIEWRERMLRRRRLAATFSGVSLGLCAFMFFSLFTLPGVAVLAGTPPAPQAAAPIKRSAPAPAPTRLGPVVAPPKPAQPDPQTSPDPPSDQQPAAAATAGGEIVLDEPVAPTPPPVPLRRPPPNPRRVVEQFLKNQGKAFRKCSEMVPFGESLTVRVDLHIEPTTGRALAAAAAEAQRTEEYAVCAVNVLKNLKYPRFVGEGRIDGLGVKL